MDQHYSSLEIINNLLQTHNFYYDIIFNDIHNFIYFGKFDTNLLKKNMDRGFLNIKTNIGYCEFEKLLTNFKSRAMNNNINKTYYHSYNNIVDKIYELFNRILKLTEPNLYLLDGRGFNMGRILQKPKLELLQDITSETSSLEKSMNYDKYQISMMQLYKFSIWYIELQNDFSKFLDNTASIDKTDKITSDNTGITKNTKINIDNNVHIIKPMPNDITFENLRVILIFKKFFASWGQYMYMIETINDYLNLEKCQSPFLINFKNNCSNEQSQQFFGELKECIDNVNNEERKIVIKIATMMNELFMLYYFG